MTTHSNIMITNGVTTSRQTIVKRHLHRTRHTMTNRNTSFRRTLNTNRFSRWHRRLPLLQHRLPTHRQRHLNFITRTLRRRHFPRKGIRRMLVRKVIRVRHTDNRRRLHRRGLLVAHRILELRRTFNTRMNLLPVNFQRTIRLSHTTHN